MGSVAAARRYPVKSMPGESVRAALVTERGLAGDRGFGALGAHDAAGSAKPTPVGAVAEAIRAVRGRR